MSITYSADEAEAYIRGMTAAWAASIPTGDPTAVQRVFADEFAWNKMHPDGDRRDGLVDKASAVRDAVDGAGKWASCRIDFEHIKFVDHVAIVDGSKTFEARDGLRIRILYTSTWKHFTESDNPWQIVRYDNMDVPLLD